MSAVVTAVVGTAALSAGINIYSANKSAKAQEHAADTASNTSMAIYNDEAARFKPYEDVGTATLPKITGYDEANPLPSYEDTVSKPMDSWSYERSPSYLAKNALAQIDLNSQLQARGLGASGIGANRAADLSRKLTSEDFNNERAYRLSQLTDTYKAKLSDNSTRYGRLLDAVKIGQGAAASTGQAEQNMGNQVGQATMAAGNAKAAYYAGIPNAVSNAGATALKAYDYTANSGWWGDNTSYTSPYGSAGIFGDTGAATAADEGAAYAAFAI